MCNIAEEVQIQAPPESPDHPQVVRSGRHSSRQSSKNQGGPCASSTLQGPSGKQQLHKAPASIFRPNLAFQARTCDRGHRLNICLCDVNTRMCNDCSRLVPDAHTFRCQHCDFDLCRRCFARPGRAQQSAERSVSKSQDIQKQRLLRKEARRLGPDATSPELLYGVLPPVRLAERFQAVKAARPSQKKHAKGRVPTTAEKKQQPLLQTYSRSASAVSGTASPVSQGNPDACGDPFTDLCVVPPATDCPEHHVEGQQLESNLPVPVHLSQTEQWRMATALLVAATMGKKDYYRVGPPSPVRRKHWQW